MKQTIFFFTLALVLSLVSCNKEDDPIDPINTTDSTIVDTTVTDTTVTDTTDNNSSSATNNTLEAGSKTSSFDTYNANYFNDVNTGKNYYDLLIYADPYGWDSDYLQIHLGEIPSETKELSWQSSPSAPGDITADEFTVYIKVDGQQWWGEYSTTAWVTTGKMNATVNGDILTLSFSDLELGDSYLTASITERIKCNSKISINLNDIADVETAGVTASLVSE